MGHHSVIWLVEEFWEQATLDGSANLNSVSFLRVWKIKKQRYLCVRQGSYINREENLQIEHSTRFMYDI